MIVIILPAISIILAIISYPLVKIKTYTSRHDICRFDNFVMRIGIINYSPFISSSFKICCSVPNDNGNKIEQVVFVLNSSVCSKEAFDYSCFFANRGIYSVSVNYVEYYDFLKLIKLKKNISSSVSITAKPREIELHLPVNYEQQKQENSTFVGTSLVQSGGDMFGIREYAPGDNIKNMHWKLSAKYDEPVTKTFAEDIYDQAVVIADMSAYFDEYKSKSMTDCVLETTLSAIRDYAANSIRFSLFVNINKNEIMHFRVSAVSDLYETEKAIQMTPMVNDSSIIDLLKNVDSNLMSGCEVCIITSFASDDVLKSIKKMFIDQINKLNVIRISEYDIPNKDGVLSYSREFIENRKRGTINETV